MGVQFTLDFLSTLVELIGAISPILFFLLGVVAMLAILIARREGWPIGEGLYFGFITATTVGYGDLRPTQPLTRLLAIVIAFVGLTMTGIIVALAVEAMGHAYELSNVTHARLELAGSALVSS